MNKFEYLNKKTEATFWVEGLTTPKAREFAFLDEELYKKKGDGSYKKVAKKIEKGSTYYRIVVYPNQELCFTPVEITQFLQDPEKTISNQPDVIWERYGDEITDLYLNSIFSTRELEDIYNIASHHFKSKIVGRKPNGFEFYKGYYIKSVYGFAVVQNSFGKIINPYLRPDGNGRVSYSIELWDKEKKQYFSLHNLIARYFIPNPDNLITTRSKDNKPTTKISEIEWGRTSTWSGGRKIKK